MQLNFVPWKQTESSYRYACELDSNQVFFKFRPVLQVSPQLAGPPRPGGQGMTCTHVQLAGWQARTSKACWEHGGCIQKCGTQMGLRIAGCGAGFVRDEVRHGAIAGIAPRMYGGACGHAHGISMRQQPLAKRVSSRGDSPGVKGDVQQCRRGGRRG